MGFYLFWSFLKIGFFCFGGGSAMIGVFEQMFVKDAHYLTSTQFADIIAISQITPGPIAVNFATYVGAVVGDTPMQSVYYSFVATLGISLPAFFIVIIIAKFFVQFGESKNVKRVMGGIKPGVIGLVAGSMLLLCRLSLYDAELMGKFQIFEALNYSAILLAVTSFILALKTKINPMLILVGSGLIGILIF